MKKIVTGILLTLLLNVATAQQKISWSFTAKKLADNRYELHMTATPPSGWHVYSQTTPEGGPIPTEFKFTNNGLVTVAAAKPKEVGKLVSYFDKNFKVNVKYFEGKVDFVKTVTVKGKIKTNVSGTVESMICNDRTCMPPTTENFNIALN
ncbi:protein-disulfide reductase DsbD family protein [Ferruginibacter paludis]|uniref:protein-disulfide reductase DsbD domain-containing protein n=1 Tax=Ferruginibacter paludis TaxID=1310417 RepID=UPI0025B4252E|nr:protein-disulfide reductase DsbD domain-containing protein [Ferruginibacter paludis]MDN3657778.1 protein-disulfide reductase DsbD family protein [Ferruginibacter paludis]